MPASIRAARQLISVGNALWRGTINSVTEKHHLTGLHHIDGPTQRPTQSRVDTNALQGIPAPATRALLASMHHTAPRAKRLNLRVHGSEQKGDRAVIKLARSDVSSLIAHRHNPNHLRAMSCNGSLIGRPVSTLRANICGVRQGRIA